VQFEIAENEDSTMNVTVYLEKPDPVLAEISALRAENEQLKAVNRRSNIWTVQ